MRKPNKATSKFFITPSIDEVIEIRKLYPEFNMSQLAKKYKTSLLTIHNIVNRITWQNV